MSQEQATKSMQFASRRGKFPRKHTQRARIAILYPSAKYPQRHRCTFIIQAIPTTQTKTPTSFSFLFQLPYATCFPLSIYKSLWFHGWASGDRSCSASPPQSHQAKPSVNKGVKVHKSRPPPFSRRKKANARLFPSFSQPSQRQHRETQGPQAMNDSKRNADPAFLLFPLLLKEERRITRIVGTRVVGYKIERIDR